MKVILPRIAKGHERYECHYCGCTFDFDPKKDGRRRKSDSFVVYTIVDVQCPVCRRWNMEASCMDPN